MLTVHFEQDKEVIEKLCKDFEIDPYAKCSNFVLRDSDEPIGLMRTEIGDTVKIVYFNILKRAMNYESREFFFRAMLFKFSLNPIPLEVEGKHEELEKFGFMYNGKSMIVESSNIILSPHHQ